MLLLFAAPAVLNSQQVKDSNTAAEGENDPDSPWIKDVPGDYIRRMQLNAIENEGAYWGHWGGRQDRFSGWTSHSNRLIPIYSFGMELSKVRGENAVWRSEDRLRRLYGEVPRDSLNPDADYLDQSDVYRLQKYAMAAGKKYIILFIFDGMDWQTTRAAAVCKTGRVAYLGGRGTGLHFQDYRGVETDFGYFVTSPHNTGTKFDVNAQTVENPGGDKKGGYNVETGGRTPWSRPLNHSYLLGNQRDMPHAVTDSAASATSMTCGIKTYNGAIGVDYEGNQVVSIAHQLQFDRQFSIGVVTSVPISHATPAAAYANNVNRDDYQDLTRDLLGLHSNSHRDEPTIGVDVLMGCGWGELIEKEDTKEDKEKKEEEVNRQGENFVPGNKYITDKDLHAIDVEHGGSYRIAQRTKGRLGKVVLEEATQKAIQEGTRLFGFFGVENGHLPFQTADGSYNPTRGAKAAERYTEADISENVTLTEMTQSALRVLETNEDGFWLMVEAGDVDWANHDNNIDNAIGAVLGGDDAFRAITDWVEDQDAWKDTVIVLTADHGHYLVLRDPSVLFRRGL